MNRIGDLMEALGFDPEGSATVKEAFIKHLLRVSEDVHVLTPSEKSQIAASPEKIKVLPVQLVFDFSKTGTDQE